MRWWRELKAIMTGEQSFAELMRPGRARRNWRRAAVLLREAYFAARRSDIGLLADALVYKSLVALIPTLAIFLAVASMAGRGSHGEALIAALKETLPPHPEMARILDTLQGFADSAWIVAGGGAVMLLWTAFSLLGSIEGAFNRIWQAEPRRTWLGRASSYLSTLILVPILLSASVVVTGVAARTARQVEERAEGFWSWASRIGSAAPDATPDAAPAPETAGSDNRTASPAPVPPPESAASGETPAAPESKAVTAAIVAAPDSEANPDKKPASSWFIRGVLMFTSALLTIAGLAAFYYLMPDTTVRLRAALYGALLSGVLFEIAKAGFHYYVEWMSKSYAMIYGSLLALPLFLIWLRLVWWMLLLGAELSFVTQNFADLANRTDMERRGIRRRGYLAVRTVLAAARRFRNGDSPEDLPDQAARELSVPPYLTRALAEELANQGLLRRVQGLENGYVPGRDPARLTVAMVARAAGGIDLQVVDPGLPPAKPEEPPADPEAGDRRAGAGSAVDDWAERRLAEVFGQASASVDQWLGTSFSTLLAEEETPADESESPVRLLPPPVAE